MVSRYFVIFLLAIFLSECRPATPPPTILNQTPVAPAPVTRTAPAPQTPTPAPDYVAQMRNSQYQLGTPEFCRLYNLSTDSLNRALLAALISYRCMLLTLLPPVI